MSPVPTKWTASDIPDLTGRTALVTGANSGLGFWSATELARHGAHVVMACRDPKRAAAALDRLKVEVPAASVELLSLDLASLASVEKAAASLSVPKLDILMANAGVMAIPRRQTADGFEMQFGTNHLGHFALVGRLLPLLLSSDAARVVVTSSDAHKLGTMRFEDLMGERRYNNWLAYAQSKLANLLFVRGLARRAAGTSLVAAGAHPGYAATNLQSGQGKFLLETFMKIGNTLIAQSDAHGAWPQEYAATAPGVVAGAYYGPGGFMNSRGNPVQVTPTKKARSDADAERLWVESERLTGVTYQF